MSSAHLYSRIDHYVIGAAAMTVAVTAGGSALISFPATTSYRLYHGDATHNTADGVAPVNEGTDCVGVVLAALLNAAGLGGVWTVTWDRLVGAYAIARDSGTFTLSFDTDDVGVRMRRMLGHSGNRSAAASIVSNQPCWYWFPFPRGWSDDSGRQALEDRGYSAVTGGRAYGVRAATLGYGRRLSMRHVEPERAINAEGGAEAWTLERLGEHHFACERAVLFAQDAANHAYASRFGTFQLSPAGLAEWAINPIDPNWHGTFSVPLDLVEWPGA